MARKVLLAAVIALFGAGCCDHSLALRAVREMEQAHEMILPEYLSYVDADAKLDRDEKTDRHKQAEALKRAAAALRGRLEE